MSRGAPPARPTVVKICGITRSEDAAVAVEAGADWLGFVLKGETPRRIAPEVAAAIASRFTQVAAVAVMVAPSPAEALELAREARAVRVQLHRVEPALWPTDFPLPVTFVVPVDGGGNLQGPVPETGLVLLDRADPLLDGGTGRSLPWQQVSELARRRDVMLAGGLDADNVAQALEVVRPYGVDASSRLESSPGVKDPERVRRFVAAVRAWERPPREAESR